MTTESPKETIISVARDNAALRWVTIFLAFGLLLSGFSNYVLLKRPTEIWVITEDGRIMQNGGQVFSWEVHESVKKAVELAYVESSDRERLLPAFYSADILNRVKKNLEKDKMVNFDIRKIEYLDKSVQALGILKRFNTDDTALLFTLVRTGRNPNNPFGFMVSQVTPAKMNQALDVQKSTGTDIVYQK